MPFIAVPREDVDPPMPTLSGLPLVIPYDQRQIPELGMVALKIYAFGGLAIMVATIVAAFSYWFWTIVIRHEWADSPPSLDLDPDRMREQELKRIARHKARKEAREKERELRELEPYTPPPVRLFKRKNRERSSTLPVIGFGHPSGSHPKSNLFPASSIFRPRKSSFSTPSSKGKKDRRVSWASSTTTLDGHGNTFLKPLEIKQGSSLSKRSMLRVPSSEPVNSLRRAPRARSVSPRVSISIEPRARQGPDMALMTTPEMVSSWARPQHNFD